MCFLFVMKGGGGVNCPMPPFCYATVFDLICLINRLTDFNLINCNLIIVAIINCFFYVTVPLFVFQWLYDEVQMKAENVGTPVTKQQWEYIHTMGEILRNSFQNVT